jgi:hypothetical protein
MARGTTLVRLIDMLRAEIKASLNPAHNRQVRDVHVQALQQAQIELWEDYQWPFLNITRTLQLTAGTYQYSLPADVGLDAIQGIEVRWGGVWVPLVEGIGAEQESSYDSALDERSWPVERWKIAEGNMIEVWPCPSDTGTSSDLEGYLRFHAKQQLGRLVDDSDTTTLDDRLIMLLAAMSFATDKEYQKADGKFKARLAHVRGNMAPRQPFRMFGDQRTTRELRGPPRVHYRVNET